MGKVPANYPIAVRGIRWDVGDSVSNEASPKGTKSGRCALGPVLKRMSTIYSASRCA